MTNTGRFLHPSSLPCSPLLVSHLLPHSPFPSLLPHSPFPLSPHSPFLSLIFSLTLPFSLSSVPSLSLSPLSCIPPPPLSLCCYYTLTVTSLSRASLFPFTSSPPPPSPLLPATSLRATSYRPTSSVFSLSCAVSRDTSCRHCSPRRLSDVHTPCNSVT